MKNTLSTFLILLALSGTKAQSPDFAWTKQMGGSSHETPYTISLDASGNIYTSGYFEGTVDFDPGVATYSLASPGDISIFVSKLDAQGNFLWAKKISPPVTATNSDAKAFSHVLCSNGDICISGYFKGVFDFDPGVGNVILYAASEDVFVLKLDTQGNYLWAKQFGGTDADMANGITLDASNNVYTTGFFMDTVDFNPGVASFTLAGNITGGVESFISKLDAAGNFVWAKKLTTTVGSIGNDICVDAMGNILSTGTFDGTSDFDPGIGIQNITSVADQDIYVWKLDASGNFIWAKTMGGMTKEGGVALTSDAQGNAFIGGFFTGTVDFDPGIGVNNHSSLGNDDSFVLKLNSQGNLQWVNTMGGTGTDVTSSLALDANGALYSVGQFSGTVDFNAGPGTYTLSSSVINSFISKVDNQGNFKWTKQISGGQNAASSIAVDGNSNVYTTGYFFSSADFDPNTGVFNLTALGEEDIYIHKMSCGNVPEINVTSSNILLCEGNTATIIASGALTYTWNTSGTNPLVVSPTVTTNYQVSGSDANGCKSSVTITQSVTNCTSLETQDNTKKGFQINPNPNNGLMTLTLPINDEHGVTITILNTLGQTVYSEDSYLPQTILSIENLPNGIYFLNVFQNRKSHGMIKIIKQ